MFSEIWFAVAGKEGKKEMERENHTHLSSSPEKWLKYCRTDVVWVNGLYYDTYILNKC